MYDAIPLPTKAKLTDDSEAQRLEDARRKIESWRLDYNHFRTHSSLGDIPPAEFAARFSPSTAAEFSSSDRY